MRPALIALVGTVLATVAASVAAATTPPPVVGEVEVNGQVLGLTEDAHSLAWVESTKSGCRLGVLSLDTGAKRFARYAAGCFGERDVALAGTTVGWGGYEEVRCSETYSTVYVTVGKAARKVEELPGDCRGSGLAFV